MAHDERPMRPPQLRVEPGRDRMREPHGLARPVPFGGYERPAPRFSAGAANEPPDEPA